MTNEMKRFPYSIYIKEAKFANAIMKLNSFVRSHNIKELPQDVQGFLSNLGWDQIQKDIPTGLYHWPGNDWAEKIIQQWEWEDEILKKAIVALNPIMSEINRSAKYFFAWQIIQTILSMKSNLSYELLWESIEELACSFLLLKEGYYKQAFQSLRNYLEICVSLLYFSVNEISYKEWIKSEELYHFPKFHKDRNGNDMLTKLGEYLDKSDIDFMSNQYSSLNSSVHVRRHRINMNISRLKRLEKDFGKKDILYWNKTFNNLVKFMAILFLKALFVAS